MIALGMHKELFSEAWVRAVAAAVGFRSTKPEGPDDDSVDLTIHETGPRGMIRSPKLDIQLKCTANTLPNQDFTYPLPVKNYDDLRATDLQVPRILIVVIVPDNTADWAAHNSAELSLRRCGYWCDLRGLPATTNTATVSVTMPISQELSPTAIDKIMMPRAQGGVL